MIQEEVDKLASLQFEVFLKRASVRFFVDGARGSTLLKQEVGEENVTLDVSSTSCKIIVRGGESARHCLHKLIDESLSDAIRSQHQLKDEETCPREFDAADPEHMERQSRLFQLPSGPKLLPDAFDCILARVSSTVEP